MPPKHKSRQATVEPESPGNGEDNGEASGETGGELVPVIGHGSTGSTAPLALIPGFSQEQVSGLMIMIAATIDAKLEQRLGNFNTNRQQISPFPSIEDRQAHQEEQPSYNQEQQPSYNQGQEPSYVPEQNVSHTHGTTYHTNPSQLRAEHVGYFDPEYQPEHGQQGPVVNAGKYVYYRDVYVFVDRLKDLAMQHDVKQVISSCFRGSALMWYSMELTDLERTGLRNSDPALWYTTLINRFKTRTSVALSQLVGQTYSLHDIKHTSPRAFIQQMLHLAKSAEFHSTYNQLTLLWNQFAVNLRRDLPEPQPSTTIGQFLEQVDTKTPIWMELAYRQSPQQRPWQSRPALQDSTPNGQRSLPAPQQQQPSSGKYPPRRVTFEDRKAHAYLADVTSDGYGIYGEEDEVDPEHQGQ